MHDSTRAWLLWLGGTKAVVGYFFFARPDLMQSGAYDWAEALLPFWAWGIISVSSAVLCLFARWTERLVPAYLGLGLAGWLHFIFGLSILALSLQGVTSAIIGSLAWWTSAAVSVWLLKRGL